MLRARADLVVEAALPLMPKRRRRSDRIRMLRSLGTFTRNLVHNRRCLAGGDEAIRPLFFIWTMLNACNFACTYCDNHRGQKYPELSNAGRLDTRSGAELLRVMRTGTSALYFCGGEPTLRRDLPELAEVAAGLGYWPLMVNTNGSRFHHLLTEPAWVRWLTQMDVIIVSLDSLDLDVLAQMYVYERPEEVIVNVLALSELSKRAGFKLFLNTVIQPDRLQDARDVLGFAREIGAYFSCVPMNTRAQIHESLARDPDYVALAEEIIRYSEEGGRVVGGTTFLRRLLFSDPIRCHPTAFLHVSPQGEVIWPCKPSVKIEPVQVPVLGKRTLDEVWDEGRTAIEPTGFHGCGPDQCGGDCNWAQHYVGDSIVRFLRKPLAQGWVARSLWQFLSRR